MSKRCYPKTNYNCDKRYVIGPTGHAGPRGETGPMGPSGIPGPGVEPYYGSFYDNTIQTNEDPGTNIAMIFSETYASKGVSVILDSQPVPKATIIQINNTGIYDIQISAQILLFGDIATNYDVSIWLYDYIAGTAVANSSRTITTIAKVTIPLSFNLSLNVTTPNSQYQILWFSPSANNILRYYEPTFDIPANPSATLTVSRIG